jgi:hypothetical protein
MTSNWSRRNVTARRKVLEVTIDADGRFPVYGFTGAQALNGFHLS